LQEYSFEKYHSYRISFQEYSFQIKMPKCIIKECLNRTTLIIGDCKYCKKSFCSPHRLPEDHKCENLEECKKEHFQRNHALVMGGKLIKSKV